MVQAPIFHVNGDDPEACVRAARLAFTFRQTFHKDVVIDLVCYRKHGHNEGDDPSYTQPLMYQRIDAKRSVRKLYTETLVRRGDITLEEAESALDDFNARLQTVLDEVRGEPSLAPTHLPVYDATPVPEPVEATAVDGKILHELAVLVRSVPDGFTIHPKLERQFSQRDELIAGGQVDWALAEALAIGSLLQQGINVRLTGQDTRRGTFSHRHAVLVDYATADEFIPLAHVGESIGHVDAAVLAPTGGTLGSFTVRDSLLSEYAAVGFEYGYSVEAPEALVAWEAQFGDFGNGAQIIIDNFLAAAEIKWGQYAGLVMLLPHGYEGQGPEHSSSRFERFLSLCARGNLRVVIPSTAGQYFHLLRSQALRSPKRPLIVVTPKSLLRAHVSRSTFDELEHGSFQTVIDDAGIADASRVRRIVLCSGKVAHEALQHRNELSEDEAAAVAIVRVEQLYPWPIDKLAPILERYAQADNVTWLQEEPENMGAWSFVHARLHAALPERFQLQHVSRTESASPAIGSAALHQLEQADLLQRAVG
jgi:2-oxoglutarate dehydrogenase E1 component